MTLDDLRNFCLSLKGVEEKMPFDDRILTFNVKGKIFCLADVMNFDFINLKCDPNEAISLRERYEDVTPGYHMNKKHWNSVRTNGRVSRKQIKEWVKQSYLLVVSGLPKKLQEDLQ